MINTLFVVWTTFSNTNISHNSHFKVLIFDIQINLIFITKYKIQSDLLVLTNYDYLHLFINDQISKLKSFYSYNSYILYNIFSKYLNLAGNSLKWYFGYILLYLLIQFYHHNNTWFIQCFEKITSSVAIENYAV